MATLFFSYAHEDEPYREKLETHLSMLKRQGLIEVWHDRRITPGQHIDHIVDEHLQRADIILLLVSPDFLASDYCYDVEVRQALERHQRGEATVIPVVVRPCDWHGAPFGRLLALPRDGIAVATWSDPDQALLDIVTGIKAALGRPRRPAPSGLEPSRAPLPSAPGSLPIRLGSTRIPRRFSELEKDDFLEDAFEHIARLFETSLAELHRANPDVDTRFRRLDAGRLIAVAYRAGRPVSRCTIWKGGRSTFVRGIGDVDNESGETTTLNESISVEADDDSLYLKPMGMPLTGHRPPEKMNTQAACEYLWDLFLRRLRERP